MAGWQVTYPLLFSLSKDLPWSAVNSFWSRTIAESVARRTCFLRGFDGLVLPSASSVAPPPAGAAAAPFSLTVGSDGGPGFVREPGRMISLLAPSDFSAFLLHRVHRLCLQYGFRAGLCVVCSTEL